jgi:hypothetical protein
MGINLIQKSNRLLQSRRYTTDGIQSFQEAFTRVLDLGSSEIYTQTNLIPTSSLPFSGSGQDQQTSGVIKYWYRFQMTPDSSRQVWMFVNPPQVSSGIQLLNPNQLTNFISPKYIRADLGDNNTELTSGTGYKIVVSNGTTSASASPITAEEGFTFDYKTGVLQFSSSAYAPSSGNVYVTAYQYVGRTLADDATLGYSGSFSGSFQGNGNGLTNIPAGSIVGLNLTQIATATVSASVSSTGNSFTVSSASVNLLTIDSGSKITATTFSGSLIGVSNTTGSLTGSFTGIGSGSFSGSFQGNGGGLTNLPASSIVGLNLSQTATGSVSASVNVGATSFQVVSGSSTLLSLSNTGDLTISGSEFIGNNITANGNAVITGSLTVGASSSLRDTTVTGSMLVTQNLTVLGTASFTRVTGSEIIVGASTITLSTDDPVVRFGGILVIDSGSFGQDSTGSLLWDSEEDRWIYVIPSGSAEGYNSAILIGGPPNTGSIGNEPGLTPGRITKALADDHIGSSLMRETGSEMAIDGTLSITGSTVQTTPLSSAVTSSETTGNYALLVSQSAWMYNHNAGVPRSNAWKTNLNGSYFNNFDHNTNTSEILRFIAGLLSASAPATTANTRVYNAVTSTEGSTSNTSNNPLGRVPKSSTNSTINYLNARGWAATGSTIFEGETIYYDSNYNVSYTSDALGSTLVSSSNDAQLFGLGALDETVYLSSSLAFTYREANTAVDTATSSSQSVINLTGTAPQSSGNFQKNKINSANPAVIPAGFQDGKFASSFLNGIFVGGNNIAGRSSTSVSSSGDYIIAATIGVSSSVNSGYLNKTTSVTRFYSPLYAGSTIDTSIGQNSINHIPTTTTLTATSRSLSGAPYLLGATWNYQDTASGVFSPLYYEGSSIFTLASSDGSVGIGGTTSQTLNTSNGQITGTSLIYDSTGVTQRSAGDIPSEGDIIKTTNTLTFTPSSTNIQQSSTLSPTSFTLTPTAYRRDNSPIASGSTINYHTSGTFGQPAASGSLAYTNRAQGYDGSSLTGTTENFTGEDNRVQITDAALSGSYTTAGKFTTGSYVTDNLTDLDLQVKPGYLVRPGGSYKYWLPTPTYTGGRAGGGTYKYYARAFRVTDNKASLRISTTGGTLGNWYTTSDYAVLVLFQSVWDLTGTPNVWDPTVNNSNALITGGVARDDQYNPFNTAINIYGVGQVPSTTNSIAFNDTAKQFVNTTYPNYILLFRYKGDVAPLTNITITYTS